MENRAYGNVDDHHHSHHHRKDPSYQHSAQVKIQNYFSEPPPSKKKTSRCCLACKANWEFVTVLIICLLVWGGCLALYICCEMKLFAKSVTYSAGNLTLVQRDSRDMKGQSWKNDSIPPFFPLTTPVSNTTNTRRSYFPQKLSADPSNVMTMTNSVSDCKLFQIWLMIFSGGLGLFGFVGAFCCCTQMFT